MKTAAFIRKQEELRTFVMTMLGLLQPNWPEFWGLRRGWDMRARSIGGPLKKRMSDAHLSCLAAISKVF